MATIVREPARAGGADVDVVRIAEGRTARVRDAVAVEEPLEIRLNGWRWLVTMRTPGDDADLVIGLLAAEGAIATAADVEAMLFTRHPEEPDLANVVDVTLTRPLADLQERLARHQALASTSCGLCGASSIEAVLAQRPPVLPGPPIAGEVLGALPGRLAAAQPGFHATGGLHAAALFDAAGTLLAAREDVGRHNATDKVFGWRLRAGASAAAILLVSGRASFEIVQKAVAAGIPVVAAVSAPSSLAVDLARTSGMTLAGFVRDGSFNVYAGAERLEATTAAALSDAPPAPPSDRDPDAPGAEPLDFMSRSVRSALDDAGRTISLADWRALGRDERLRLEHLATVSERAAFAAYLEERVTARTGHAPRLLPPADRA